MVRFAMKLATIAFVCVALSDSLAAATLHAQASVKTPTVSPPLQVDPSKLQGLHQHALLQQKLGFYAVLTPPDYDAPKNSRRHYPVVVILHGSASSEVRHGKLADEFGRREVIYVVPRAPYLNEEVALSEQRIAWTGKPTYPTTWGAAGSATYPTAELAALDAPGLYVEWIHEALADARRRYRITRDKAVLVGHSQGGEYAHIFSLRHPELVKGYLTYAGHFEVTLDKPDDPHTADVIKQNGIDVGIVQHEGDERVPVSQARDLAAYYKRYGVKHQLVILPGGDHMFDASVYNVVKRFIQEQTQRR